MADLNTEHLIETIFVKLIGSVVDPQGLPAFVSVRFADVPQGPRIVVRADDRGENASVKISGRYAREYSVTISIEVPPADAGDAAGLSALAGQAQELILDLLSSQSALTTACSTIAEIASFSLLQIDRDEEASKDVDNDLLNVQMVYTATAFRI